MLTQVELNEDELNKLVKLVDDLGYSEEMLKQLYYILSLTYMYLDGTEKELTVENLNCENGILDFISDLKPLLHKIGTDITLSNIQIRSILELLIKHKKIKH